MEDARQKGPQDAPRGFLTFDDLSAVLAHEIANPLSNISAAVHLLEQYLCEQHLNDATSELLRLTKEEIDRLTLLLDNFRSVKRFSLDLQPTSLPPLVRDCLALESVKAERQRIQIECDIPADLPVIMADGSKLRQVILNLCENAIEAMPDGGTVRVLGYTNPAEVCLDIRDSGEGISEGIQMFAPFVSTKGRGSGIGLFISQQIVSAHGGTINYESKKGEGTIFHLVFPTGDKRESKASEG